MPASPVRSCRLDEARRARARHQEWVREWQADVHQRRGRRFADPARDRAADGLGTIESVRPPATREVYDAPGMVT